MNAMIFAAGIGNRLKPFTDNKPKALVSMHGKPMLQWVIEKLVNAGACRIVINVHHFPAMMESFISELNYPGVVLQISDETQELLDTGGGLKKAVKFLNNQEVTVLHNVDIVSDINLKDLVQTHKENDALATLAVTKRDSTRMFLWNEDRLAGWENRTTGERLLCKGIDPHSVKPMAFSGIHVVSPEIFSLISETGPFSIKDLYLRFASDHVIKAYEHNADKWADIGTPEKLAKAIRLTNEFPEMLHP